MTRVRWTRSICIGAGAFAAAALLALVPLAWKAARETLDNRVVPRVAAPEDAYRIIVAAIELSRLEGAPPPPPSPPPRLSPTLSPSSRAAPAPAAAPGEALRPEVRKPVVLIEESIAICDDPPEPTKGCPLRQSERKFVFAGADPRIPRSLRLELVAANRVRQPLPCKSAEWIRCSDQQSVDAVFAEDGWWDDFYRRFPGTAGLVRVSTPVLSDDGQQALVYLSFACDGHCGSDQLLLLERTGTSWRIKYEELLSIS